MNAKRMLLRFLIGNGTYDRLVRMNVIQDAGVVGRRAHGQKARNDLDELFDKPISYRHGDEYQYRHISNDAVPDHQRLAVLGEMPRHSPVDLNLGYPTQM